jgi:CRISPR-associated protein Cmr2
VADVIMKQCGEDSLIFPGSLKLNGDNREKGVANKIVAIVPSESVEIIVQKAQTNVKTELLDQLINSLHDDAIHNHNYSKYLLLDIAIAQVTEMMEFFWVSVPCAGREGQPYVEARTRAESLLAARKNLHDWQAVTWGDCVPKSSLDGDRESVLHEDLYDHIKTMSPSTRDHVRKIFGVEGNERLCGIGLLKRIGGNEQNRNFHSTSHIAAIPLRSHFKKEKVRQAFDLFIEELQDIAGKKWLSSLEMHNKTHGFYGENGRISYDGGIFFENRLLNLLKEYGDFSHANNQKQASKRVVRALEKMLSAMKDPDTQTPQPTPYYGLLLADGDRMGLIIDHQQSFAQHKKLSRALDQFSSQVQKIVKLHEGSLIYAGGDDVLALVPMHQAIPCARALADDFANRLNEFAFTENHNVIKPTLSVGIAIAHHLALFGQVRTLAKKAEQLAKQNRNSLAIIIDKRSGGSRSISGSWTVDLREKLPLDQRLERWKEIIAQKDVNHGFLYEVESIARFGKRDTKDNETTGELSTFAQMLIHELERVMSRKKPSESKSVGLSEEVRETLRAFVQRGEREGDIAASLQALSNELYLALELVRIDNTIYQGQA